MARSRSALRFLRRAGLLDDSLRPRPRIRPDAFYVNNPPAEIDTPLTPEILRDLEGRPAPDRNVSRPWPDEL